MGDVIVVVVAAVVAVDVDVEEVVVVVAVVGRDAKPFVSLHPRLLVLPVIGALEPVTAVNE